MTNDSKHQISNQPEGVGWWQEFWQCVRKLGCTLMSLAIRLWHNLVSLVKWLWHTLISLIISVLIIFLAIISVTLFMELVYPSMQIPAAIDGYLKGVFSLWKWDESNSFAEVGSGFGIVSALATFVAVVLLWRTYNLQKKELRKIIQHSSDQKIWSHVFQMCEFYRSMMAKSSYTTAISSGSAAKTTAKANTKKNAKATAKANNDIINSSESLAEGGLKFLIQDLLIAESNIMWKDGINTKQDVNTKERADAFLKDAGKAFSPFDGSFRMLYRIFKYIDDIEGYDENLKDQVSRIPRSMLSNIELEAIFINSLTSRGKKMKFYVEKYKILDNYKPEVFDNNLQVYLQKRYDISTFSKNQDD